MERHAFRSLVLLLIGLLPIGIVAGIAHYADLDDLGGGVLAIIALVGCSGLLLVLFSTSALLSWAIPTPAYGTLSQREGRLGGGFLALLLLIAVIIIFHVGDDEKSPVFIPLFVLRCVGVSAGFWFLIFSIGHVLAQDWLGLFKAILIVVLILGNLLVMPIYWCLFVWQPHRRERSWTTG